MLTPIQFPVLPQNQPYCTSTDVGNLIGNTIGFQNADSTTIQSAINQATAYIERETQKKFSPYRSKVRYDGNGTTKMVLKNSPIIAINEVDIYFTYPLELQRVAHDYDLIVDRQNGVIAFSPYTAQPFFAPFAYVFYPSSRNVMIDAWFGYTEEVFSEQLATTDNLTFNFANPTVVQNTVDNVYSPTTAPVLYPIIYQDGVQLQNTIYVQVNSSDIAENGDWQIETDNIYYTLNKTSQGITSITFNQAPSGVITADYGYWLIENDVVEATAKRASITLLQSFGNALYSSSDDTLSAADSMQLRQNKITYTNQPWNGLISAWNADIASFIKKRKSVQLPLMSGYSDVPFYM